MAEINPNFNSDDLLTELQNHIGKNKGIRSDLLAEKVSGTMLRSNHHQRRIRKLISHLRNQGHHICGTPGTGYYIAANEKELNETCEFLYSRAMSSLAQVSKMKKAALPDLRGQLRLDT